MTMMKRRTAILGALAAPALLGSPIVHAQAYPNKSLRLISPSPPGGAGDVSHRLIAKYMSEDLGQQVMIENKLGGSGMIAAMEALRAGNDGYTMFVGGTTTMAANPYLVKTMPYEPSTEFQAVSITGVLPFLLVVNASLPVKSVKEFIAYAKSQPGKLSFASANSSGLVMMSMFNRMAGIDMLHVPYKGAGPALIEVVGGMIDMMFIALPPTLPHIQAGRLHAVGVGSARRAASLPNVPTLDESGLPGFDVSSHFGVLAPGGTPRPIVEKLNATLVQALRTTELKERYARLGVEPITSSADDYSRFIAAQIRKWIDVVKAAGLKRD